jgi:hypothetical protein
MDAEYRHSLWRRLRTVHGLYLEAVDTMSLEQVNTVVLDNVLPIAFSLVHQVLIEDGSAMFAGGPAPLYNDEWAGAMDLAIPNHGKELTVAEMMSQRIGNYEAFRDYQRQVFVRTEEFVAAMDPASFSEIVIAHPYPPTVANTFSARVGGEVGITRSDAIECWIYQHALRHMGEIEHARAMVGLGGMTS